MGDGDVCLDVLGALAGGLVRLLLAWDDYGNQERTLCNCCTLLWLGREGRMIWTLQASQLHPGLWNLIGRLHLEASFGHMEEEIIRNSQCGFT